MVCFAQVPTGAILIGSCDDVAAMMDRFRILYGDGVALLHVRDGGLRVARKIRKRFAAHRISHSDRFRPVPELMAFIGLPPRDGPDPNLVEPEPEAPTPSTVNTIVVDEEFVRSGQLEAMCGGKTLTYYTMLFMAGLWKPPE